MAGMNAFLNALTGRKTLRDYQHASRTFRDGNYRLAPKHKFLFYVVFNLSPTAAAIVKDETKREISMLVKSADLPTYSFDVTTMNQYNRHRNIQSKLNFNPVNIRLHDDMSDITRNMWYAYMDYYYTDQAYENYATYRYQDTYNSRVARMFGYERAHPEPFFDDIRIYSIYEKKFTEYTLINPLITNFNHDSHDHSQSDILENSMQLNYELVKYATGYIGGVGSPTGFGDLHYDKEASPLSPSGGGSASLFGIGGIFQSAGQITEDLANGKFGSAAIQGLRTVQNFQNVDLKDFVRQEAFRGIKKAIKGENPFAFPGSASSAAGSSSKYNPLPKTNVIQGTGTVTGESGYASSNATTKGFQVPGGVTGVSLHGSGAISEGLNTRTQIGSNMSTTIKNPHLNWAIEKSSKVETVLTTTKGDLNYGTATAVGPHLDVDNDGAQ
ncbi:MAG: hypothetical protein CMA64_08680 [Euryarchaeota archaeon]|jgi:hypothetical protein|nr:hypothetical protein [Euryarchaeota archaeon]